MTHPAIISSKPWFREPWPWLLASGPLLVVVASIVSAWIAIRSSDGLVSEDAYREGLAAEETLLRSEKASALGLVAHVRITSATLAVTLSAKAPSFQPPAALRVMVSHPTRAGLDQTQLLPRNGADYSAGFRLPAAGHWLILIEDDEKNWRMMGSVVLPAGGEFLIGDGAPADMHHP